MLIAVLSASVKEGKRMFEGAGRYLMVGSVEKLLKGGGEGAVHAAAQC